MRQVQSIDMSRQVAYNLGCVSLCLYLLIQPGPDNFCHFMLPLVLLLVSPLTKLETIPQVTSFLKHLMSYVLRLYPLQWNDLTILGFALMLFVNIAQFHYHAECLFFSKRVKGSLNSNKENKHLHLSEEHNKQYKEYKLLVYNIIQEMMICFVCYVNSLKRIVLYYYKRGKRFQVLI